MGIQNTFYLDVDIKRDNYVEEPQVTQNDDIVFVLRLTDDGSDMAIEGVSTYTLASLRPDGQSVLTAGSLTGPSEVTFELGSTEVSVPGRVKAAIQLYDADGRVSSIPFTYEVSKDLALNYVPSKEEKTLIELVLGEGPVILADARQATVDAIQATSDLTVLKSEVIDATDNANTSAGYANTEGERASTQADRADIAATNAEGAYNAILPVLPNIEGWGYDPTPFNQTTTYEKNNIVSHEGSTFISLVDNNIGNTPSLTANANWGVMARKGIDGTGAVSSVNGELPDGTGDVKITIPDPDLSGLATKLELQDVGGALTTHLAEGMSELLFFSRDISVLGDQPISFSRDPKAIICSAIVIGSSMSSDSFYDMNTQSSNGTTSTGVYSVAHNSFLNFRSGGENSINYVNVTISKVSAKNYKLTWTANGTPPTGAAYIRILALFHGGA